MIKALYRVVLPAFLILISISLQAQKNIESTADNLYQRHKFEEAIKLYEKLDAETPSSKTKIKIANSYRNLNDYKKAETWYSRVVNLEESDPVNMYYYAEVLRSNGKYQEALEWYRKYLPFNNNAKGNIEASKNPGVFTRDSNAYEVVNFGSINSEDSDFPCFADKNNLIISSSRAGKNTSIIGGWDQGKYYDLYEANLTDFSINEMKGDINTQLHEGPAVLDKDSKTLYFTRSNYHYRGKRKLNKDVNIDTLHLSIFTVSTNKELTKRRRWKKATPFTYNNDEYSVGHVTLTSDKSTMYFVSDMPGGKGGTDIYISKIEGDGKWGTPEALSGLVNTEMDEMFPYIHNDSVLYFASKGHPGLGGLDIFKSTISKSTGEWSRPTNLGAPVNSSTDDFAFIISENDNVRGYLSSDRAGGKGHDDVYRVFIKQSNIINILAGKVTDKGNGNPLYGVTVSATDEFGNSPISTKTNGKGEYLLRLEPDRKYKIRFENDNYIPKAQTLNTVPEAYTFDMDEELEEAIPERSFISGIVRNEEDNSPIPGVKVTVTDLLTNEPVATVLTGDDGKYKVEVEPDRDYLLRFELDGYFAQNAQVRSGDQDNVVEISRLLKPFVVDKAIEIKNIYYDLNKYDIRPDAAIELNKLVAILRDNPRVIIELSSHTDSRGSDSYNLKLSQNRAKAAVDYIISRGIAANRIFPRGYGESQLVNECANGVSCPEYKHQANRRTEFKVTGFATGDIKSTSEDNYATIVETVKGTDNFVSYTNALEYYIQLGVFGNPDLSKFNNLLGLGKIQLENASNGAKRVLLGPYYSFSSAKSNLKEVKRKGNRDAFIAPYNNGQRISIDRAKSLEN